jgi:hypothetical protein
MGTEPSVAEEINASGLQELMACLKRLLPIPKARSPWRSSTPPKKTRAMLEPAGANQRKWLILALVLQAVGGAMLLALSPAVLVKAFPAQEWGKALGLQATMTYLGMSVGPGLGGFLTQHFGWPSVFFINVPISLVLFAVSSRVLSRDGRSAGIPFDRLGTASVAVALGTLS